MAPGPFPTKGAWDRLSPGTGTDSKADPNNPSILARNGEMHELCNLAVLLMSPGAEYINGQTIAIDGGKYLAGQGGFAALSAWSDEQWTAARDMIKGANEKDRAKRTT